MEELENMTLWTADPLPIRYKKDVLPPTRDRETISGQSKARHMRTKRKPHDKRIQKN
jgi:hypothetical protein